MQDRFTKAYRWQENYVRPPVREPNTWERDDEVVATGLLDATGQPIVRKRKGMDPIGFIHFGRRR